MMSIYSDPDTLGSLILKKYHEILWTEKVQ